MIKTRSDKGFKGYGCKVRIASFSRRVTIVMFFIFDDIISSGDFSSV